MEFTSNNYVFLYIFSIDKGPIHEYYVPNVTKQHQTAFK